jgi:hypothetical protein
MNEELYTDNYGKIEPNIQDEYIKELLTTEIGKNIINNLYVLFNELYNNNRYIIHESSSLYLPLSRDDWKYYIYEKIFIDNYGNYYIISLDKTKGIIISNRSNTNNIYRLPNKLIDFIKTINYDTFNETEYEIKYFEKILINFHKVIEFTNTLITMIV